MQAFGLSLIKGRLGSDQERREIQTSPERKSARGPVFGRAQKDQDVERRRRGDRGRASRVPAVATWTRPNRRA